MIFISVGTEKFPFDRLVRAMDEARIHLQIKQEVFAQIGPTAYLPKSFPCEKFFDFDQMMTRIKEADIVVTHAGVGSTILSLNLGKIPIIFPRRSDLGEHLDDHQIEFAKKMEGINRVIVAYDEVQLIEKINNYHKILRTLKPALGNSKDRLVNYLRQFCRTF